MPKINSINIRRGLGLHVSTNETEWLDIKYPFGDVSCADKYLRRDIKRITHTLNHTSKPKVYKLARFLSDIRNSDYYTPAAAKALHNYNINYGGEFGYHAEKICDVNEHTYASAGGDSSAWKIPGKYTYINKNKSATHEYANLCSPKSIEALKKYTQGYYSDLNDALRCALPQDRWPQKIQEVKEGLDEIFTKSTNTGSVIKTYRGSPLKTNLSYLKEGETGTVKGYLSTSRSVIKAHKFRGEGEEFNIIFGKNGRDIAGESTFPEEREVLYPAGTKLRKLFHHDVGRMRMNVLEEVSEAPGSDRKCFGLSGCREALSPLYIRQKRPDTRCVRSDLLSK
ncbi:ADP-ribosyltransferase [Salmonella enterica]|uniref:ADP-ribosyltransferase n=1 Tax=Salmonella enterica TaxID=28901 RepID=UPI0009B1677D|nr:ADP-ribosyltransferase [Salmonella enterica]